MRRTLVKWGRPRITVDITLLKYLRDDYLRDGQHLGWLPIERKYYLYSKQRVSRDTLRRRYLEDSLDRLERRIVLETCGSNMYGHGSKRIDLKIHSASRCSLKKPPKTKTRFSTCSFHTRHQCGNVTSVR